MTTRLQNKSQLRKTLGGEWISHFKGSKLQSYEQSDPLLINFMPISVTCSYLEYCNLSLAKSQQVADNPSQKYLQGVSSRGISRGYLTEIYPEGLFRGYLPGISPRVSSRAHKTKACPSFRGQNQLGQSQLLLIWILLHYPELQPIYSPWVGGGETMHILNLNLRDTLSVGGQRLLERLLHE